MSETIHKAADECYIRIIPADTSSPAGKLADAEIHYTDQAPGILAGLRITGFAVWAPRSPNAGRNVTMPARTWITGRGERRTYAIVRPRLDNDPTHAIAALSASIREAYQAHERAEAAAYQAAIKARQDARQQATDDDNADLMASARNEEADAAYNAEEAARRAFSDRLATMTEEEAAEENARRIAAARLASQQPGGINILDLAPGGKFGTVRTPGRGGKSQ